MRTTLQACFVIGVIFYSCGKTSGQAAKVNRPVASEEKSSADVKEESKGSSTSPSSEKAPNDISSTSGVTNAAPQLDGNSGADKSNQDKKPPEPLQVQTCNLKVDFSDISIGQAFTFSMTYSPEIPASAKGYWSGTKNGITDSKEVPFDQPDLHIWTAVNNGSGIAATYTRILEIRDGSKTLCKTNVVQVYLKGMECVLSVNESIIGLDQPLIFSTKIVGSLPAGAQAFWYGTKDGVLDAEREPFGQPDIRTWTATNDGKSKGLYTRSLSIENAAGEVICRSNQVAVTLQ